MMGKLAKLHDVQELVGCVAALSRFVAWLGEKAPPSTHSWKNQMTNSSG
jgi:hypothetical protein